jgi:YesN/AraC family two-component response regulator
MKAIEDRYSMENAYIEAISKGEANTAEKTLSKLGGVYSPEERVPQDHLRNLKNYYVVLNTLMRKAAEQGLVHPVHIDEVSSYFSHLIETVGNEDDLSGLVPKMITRYCELVNTYSMSGYSPVIRDLITFIEYHIQDPLSLGVLAGRFHINPSYLSALFKKQTGETLTEFINRRRVKFSARLLKDPSLSVQAAAEHSGFLDINYFCRLFKRYYGQTPSAFRLHHRRNGGNEFS